MTTEETQKILILTGRIATYISFMPLIYSIIKIRIFGQSPYIYLLMYFIMGALLNWGTSAFVEYSFSHYEEIKDFLTKWEIDDTFFVDPLYFLKNFILLGLFIYFSVTSQKSKRAIAVFSFLGIIFTIVNSVWGETYKEYQSVGSSVDNVYKIFAGGVILNWIFNSDLNKRLWKIPYYWFAMAIIVIGAIAGLIDFLSNYMFKETSVIFYQVHIVKNFMMIIAFIMFTIGIYFIKKPARPRA